MAKKEIICAGFGGQGVLTAGMLLINAGMIKMYYFTHPTVLRCAEVLRTVP